MNIKLLKKLKKVSDKFSNMPKSTNANLEVIEGGIYLDLEGVVSSILIQYTGVVTFESRLPQPTKVVFSKNTILITNVFRHKFKKEILKYYGDINITHCKILNFDNSSVEVSINNQQQENFISSSNTHVEDENIILYHEDTNIKAKGSRGLISREINMEKIEGIKSKREIKDSNKKINLSLMRGIKAFSKPKQTSKSSDKLRMQTKVQQPKSSVKAPVARKVEKPKVTEKGKY